MPSVLARFDAWLGGSKSRARCLAPPAKAPAAIAKLEKTLGARLPASLRALYAWHDGETESSTLLDALCRDDHAAEWDTYNPAEPEIRLMNLAQIASAGAFDVRFDEETGECIRLSDDDDDDDDGSGLRAKLVPFLWIHAREPDGAVEEGLDAMGPHDDDWLVAVDTLHEAVWLFEIADEGLEGVLDEASSLAAWLDVRVERLESDEVTVHDDEGEGEGEGGRASRPAAELLLQFLLDRRLLELAEGASLPKVALRMTPLLGLKPEKRAIEEVIGFFEDDDDVDEVFADDDMLKAIAVEFLD
jgi:hypothetical protein